MWLDSNIKKINMQTEHYRDIFNHEKKHWWYKTRRKLIKMLLQKYSDKNQPKKILDIGCGAGALLDELKNSNECFGIDKSSLAIEFCQKRKLKNLKIGSIEKLPYPNEKFDVVLALDVLEHIKNDAKAISEIKRITKKDGLIIIFVPAFSALWSETDIISNHHRRYLLGEISQKIKKQGLTILKKSYFNTFLFVPIFLVRLLTKIFKIKNNVEIKMNNSFLNKIFYIIFSSEINILKHVSLPFGVSCMVVAKK